MRREKGITLIALVITIIIIVILAGVSMWLMLKDGGIMQRAREADEIHQRESDKEIINLIIGDFVAGKLIENKDVDLENLTDELMIELANKFDENKCVYVCLKSPQIASVLYEGEMDFQTLHVRVTKKSKYEFVIGRNLQIIDIIRIDGKDIEGDVVIPDVPDLPEEPEEPGNDLQLKEVPEGWIGIYNETD